MENQDIMKHAPTVSVIVPNYNYEKYLKERIDSILTQTFSDYELILLDDCSTDGSRNILKGYADNPHVSEIILNETNSGSPFAQWEKGIRAARGKYVWIAESDDSAEPEFLEKTVAALEAHPKARICLTGSQIIDSEGDPRHDYDNVFDNWTVDGLPHIFNAVKYLSEKMLVTNTVYNASMVLFRREGCLDRICEEYKSMRFCGDWLFWVEQIRKGEEIVELHEKLNRFRKHGTNVTFAGETDWKSIEEVCFIKNFLYANVMRSRSAVWKDKGEFYRSIRHAKLASGEDRRKELFKVIREKAGIRKTHYVLGRFWWNVFAKNFVK